MYKDIFDDMFFYIFLVLFYDVKKGGSFFMIDEELLIYVDLIIKNTKILLFHFPQ